MCFAPSSANHWLPRRLLSWKFSAGFVGGRQLPQALRLSLRRWLSDVFGAAVTLQVVNVCLADGQECDREVAEATKACSTICVAKPDVFQSIVMLWGAIVVVAFQSCTKFARCLGSHLQKQLRFICATRTCICARCMRWENISEHIVFACLHNPVSWQVIDCSNCCVCVD